MNHSTILYIERFDSFFKFAYPVFMRHKENVRLHLGKQLETSGSSSVATADCVLSSWSDGNPPAPPLALSIALRVSMAEAEALHDRVDFVAFVKLAEATCLPQVLQGQTQWKRVERSSTFTLLKRDDEVLALARLDASVEEVASILGATTDQTHAAAMKGLYQDAFISGSVAYVQRPQSHKNEQIYQHSAVKTSSFVRSDMLSKNEQWCFAETFRCSPEGDSFILAQKSLSADQANSLPARLALNNNTRRVAQLRGVNTAYLVERLPGSHGIRVVFHALYSKDEKENKSKDEAPVVARRAVRARLLRLARGISQLSQLVHRRRYGAQVFADRSAFDERNPRCTCCTRKFKLLLPRTRCHLCGYYVCLSCTSSEMMETHKGELASIPICTRCRKSVAACDYDHMLTVLPGPERALSDATPTFMKGKCPLSPSSSSSCSDLSSYSLTSTDSSSSQMFADLLGQVVDDATSGRRHAALVVLEQLLVAGQKETQMQVVKNAELLRGATASPEVAKLALNVSNFPADPTACKFASAETRPYPMIPALIEHQSGSNEPAVPIGYPIPTNEDVRLDAIEHFRLHDVANIPELNVICTLAAAEMGCPHSVLTLVEREIVTLLATNSPENWDVGSGNPREQTFCQHFVMDDQPLLVRHAEADMRFYHIAPVVKRSLRFYAGFPISVSKVIKSEKAEESDKVVVGALCCLDATPHQMTRSQYWRLMKLAQAASEILEKNADEYITSLKTGLGVHRTVGVQATITSNPTVAVAC